MRRTCLLCLLALALCSVPAMAGTLYSNLGTGSTVYNCCTGWTISGTGSVGTSFTSANQFEVTTGGSVSEIDVGVGYVEGANSFYVDVDANSSSNTPGTVLASFTGLSSSTPFGDCCGLVKITNITGLTLNTGTEYWLVIGPTSTSGTTWEAWNFSNSATGLDEYSTNGGSTWNSNGTQSQGAFQIIGGGTIPEPTSLLLMGSGLLGVVAAFRRKLNL